jgi:hypothetical protein
MQSLCRRDADIHARDGRAPRPYDSFTAGFARARENITQNSTAMNAPIQSSITSCTDAVHDGTNDWWNSSDAANAAATTKALSAKIVLLAVLNVPLKPRHKSAAKTAYFVKCPIFGSAARF